MQIPLPKKYTESYSLLLWCFNYFRKALPFLINKVETVRTYPVKRVAFVPETWSQLGVDLEAIVIGSQLERESRVGLLFKALVSI